MVNLIKTFWLGISFFSLVVFISGCADQKPPAPNGGRGGFAFPVEIGKPVMKDVSDQLKVVGNIQSEISIDIASEINARVLSVEVQEGSQVREGQLLIQLESEQYELEVARLSSEVKSAGLELEKAQKGLRPESQDRIRAELASAESQLTLATREFEKQHSLYQEKIIPKNELDLASDRLKRAKARVKSFEAELNASKISRQEEIIQLQQALQAKQKELELAELTLSKTRIHSPVNGVIVDKLAQVGNFVESGTTLFKLSGADQMVVVLNVPQAYRKKLEQLESIQVYLEESKKSLTIKSYLKERLRPIPFGDISTGSMFVLVGVPDKNNGLFPGQTLEAELKFKKRKQVLHVPSIALVISEKGSAVYKFKDGKAHLVPVKSFKEKDNLVEIVDFTHQIKPNSMLVLKGSGAVYPGASVFPTNVPPNTGKNKKAASQA